jgi:hypothetical protein
VRKVDPAGNRSVLRRDPVYAPYARSPSSPLDAARIV